MACPGDSWFQEILYLTPVGGDREGYYLNNARINNYVELFGFLRSMLNVCILALEAEEDSTPNIKNKETDVKNVLEFSRNFIPLDEGNLLDDLRQMKNEVAQKL